MGEGIGKSAQHFIETVRKFLGRIITVAISVAAVIIMIIVFLSDHRTGPEEFGDGYFHLSQGSELFPYEFFEVIERADSRILFKDDLQRYGLIPDPRTGDENPLGLPVGLTVARHRGAPGKMIGMSCAACHSGQIEYNGRVRQIVGGPGMFDPDRFFAELADAAEATLHDREKRYRFLRRYVGHKTGLGAVLAAFESEDQLRDAGPFETVLIEEIDRLIDREIRNADQFLEDSPPNARHVILTGRDRELPEVYQGEDYSKTLGKRPEVKAARKLPPAAPAVDDTEYRRPSNSNLGDSLEDLAEDIRLLIASIRFLQNYASVRGRPTTLPGHGRVDAFGKVRNMVLPLIYDPQVERPTTAPVSFPHLWGTRQARWLHWNANTDSVMERNVLEALGSGAIVDLEKFDSTVNFDNLYKLESLTHDFEPPVWPEDILPAIDREKARRGREIYTAADARYADTSMGNCVSCHTLTAPGRDRRLIEYPQYSLESIGTDPNHAMNFNRPLDGGHGDFYSNLADLAGKITRRYYEENNISDQLQNLWEDGRRPVVWRSPIDAPLIARPLMGIWATGPFLHNGSVPTLYDLLLPAADRPTTFTVGSFRFDPVRVGFESRAEGNFFVFDTHASVVDGDGNTYPDIPNGNSNAGHEFGTALNDDDRWALVEYLKTL
jgi:hypothetical protein